MTDIRKQPIQRGLAWFLDAVNLGRRNGRAVFGAALLLIATLYAACLPVALMLPGGQPTQAQDLLATILPLFLLLSLLLPVLIGGLMHVIREAEAGRPVRALDLYAPFRMGKATQLALFGLVQILFALVGGVLVAALAGSDYWREYLAAMRGAMSGSIPVMPEPEHPRLILVLQLVFNYFSYAITLLGVPLVLFSGARVGQAIRSALSAAVRNAGSHLLAALLFTLGLIIAAIVLGLLALLLVAVGSLIHEALGAAFAVVVSLSFGAILLVVVVGGSYFAWRDTFDARSTAPPLAPNQFEA